LNASEKTETALDDIKIHVKLKMSALWASVMFCYIYADYFGLYVPGSLQLVLAGKMGPLGPVTQTVLLGTSVTLAIPSIMIFLSLVLKPNFNRLLNIVLGVLYTAIILMTMWRWAFYIFYGVIEITLTGLVVWYAWNWPRQKET
jgi:Family of unknown function (DUF6326)